MKPLLLATGNPGKIRELNSLLAHLGLKLLVPTQIGMRFEVQEDNSDYGANAALKASQAAHASGLWALADDSGLEVEALDGAPGLFSARLAGPHASDEDRRVKLLEVLRPHPRPWIARFRCLAALSSPKGSVDLAEGVCDGEVIPEERGAGGFGYDPIFLVRGLDCTMAELAPEEKNKISHRARAIQTLIPVLRQRLGVS